MAQATGHLGGDHSHGAHNLARADPSCDVLMAIRTACFPSSATKSRAYRAVQMSMGVEQQNEPRHSIDVFASVIDVFEQATGNRRSLGGASQLLRDGGDHALANRARAAARSRNSLAHLDRALLRDVERFAEALRAPALAWSPAVVCDDRSLRTPEVVKQPPAVLGRPHHGVGAMRRRLARSLVRDDELRTASRRRTSEQSRSGA